MRIRIATLADADAITEGQCAAFKDDILFAMLYPHREQYPQDFHRARAELSRLRLLDKDMIAFVAEDEETGRIAGSAMWKRLNSQEPVNPDHSILMDLERILETAMQKVTKVLFRNRAEDPNAGVKILRSMKAEKAKRLQGQTAWYLNILTVHPDFQRRGIGKMLCQKGMELAEKDGLPTYLEASEKGAGLYRSLGWVEVGHVAGASGINMTMAWYPPSCTVRFDSEV